MNERATNSLADGSRVDAPSAGSPSKGRKVLLLIAGLPVTMILASTWLWFFVMGGELDLVAAIGTANRGTLVEPPRSLQELGIQAPTGDASQWTILIPARGDCVQECEQVLYYTRQIRTAMGKYTNRINRQYLSFSKDEVNTLRQRFNEEHPKLEFLYTSPSQWQALMGDCERAGLLPGYYLVDPQGWIMMSYSAEADGKDVMGDLKFLLKNNNG